MTITLAPYAQVGCYTIGIRVETCAEYPRRYNTPAPLCQSADLVLQPSAFTTTVEGRRFSRETTLTRSQDTSDLELGLVRSRNAQVLTTIRHSSKILRSWYSILTCLVDCPIGMLQSWCVERRPANSVSTTVAVIVLEDSYLLHGMNSSYFGSDQQSSLFSTLALLSEEAFLPRTDYQTSLSQIPTLAPMRT